MLSLTTLEDNSNAYNQEFGFKRSKNMRCHLVEVYRKIKEWR